MLDACLNIDFSQLEYESPESLLQGECNIIAGSDLSGLPIDTTNIEKIIKVGYDAIEYYNNSCKFDLADKLGKCYEYARIKKKKLPNYYIVERKDGKRGLIRIFERRIIFLLPPQIDNLRLSSFGWSEDDVLYLTFTCDNCFLYSLTIENDRLLLGCANFDDYLRSDGSTDLCCCHLDGVVTYEGYTINPQFDRMNYCEDWGDFYVIREHNVQMFPTGYYVYDKKEMGHPKELLPTRWNYYAYSVYFFRDRGIEDAQITIFPEASSGKHRYQALIDVHGRFLTNWIDTSKFKRNLELQYIENGVIHAKCGGSNDYCEGTLNLSNNTFIADDDYCANCQFCISNADSLLYKL